MALTFATPVLAATSAEVTITATGYVCGSPGGFTITYISDYEVQLDWIKGVDADNTMIRAAFGHSPITIDEGYEVYNGPLETCIDNSVSLASSESVYYTAWSQSASGVWSLEYVEEDTGHLMSISFLFIGWLALAIFFTWFSSKRPEILIRLAAGLVWLGLGFWILLGGIDNIQIGDSWIQILIWVFFLMAAVPFLFQMNTEVRNERDGQVWTEWGGKPKESMPSGYEKYKKRLYRRTRR